MKWCFECGAVAPETRYTHIQGDEYVAVDVCPYCGEELTEDADMCDCGEWKLATESACDSCKEDMAGLLAKDVVWLMEKRHFCRQNAIDAMYDVLLSLEDKKGYTAQYDAFMKPITDALNRLTIRRSHDGVQNT